MEALHWRISQPESEQTAKGMTSMKGFHERQRKVHCTVFIVCLEMFGGGVLFYGWVLVSGEGAS